MEWVIAESEWVGQGIGRVWGGRDPGRCFTVGKKGLQLCVATFEINVGIQITDFRYDM